MNETQILDQYSRGDLSRREAFKRLLSVGVMAPAALALLGEEASAQTDATQFSEDTLCEYIEKLRQLIATPAFSNGLSEIAAIENSQDKRERAADFLRSWSSPDYLLQNGYDPSNTKMSFRVFEDPVVAQRTLGTSQDLVAEEFVFAVPAMPNRYGIDVQDIPAEFQTWSQSNTIVQIPLASMIDGDYTVQEAAMIDPSVALTVCVSSGPGGFACISIGSEV